MDIEASLTGYFRVGGLALATTLFTRASTASPIPSSIAAFVSEASARYPDLLRRQAFAATSINLFINGESAERDYLGRISQGFFAFHTLGVFGEAANERLRSAKETVWLVDSSVQIPALALAAPTNVAVHGCFLRLREMRVRLFTTEYLFEETLGHLRFASYVITEHGPQSPMVIAASMGQVPYRKSNLFLEGFVKWQSAGNPCDWERYLFQIFASRTPTSKDVQAALRTIGIEVISLTVWPGFSELDFAERDTYQTKIIEVWDSSAPRLLEESVDMLRKAKPEAEAVLIVLKERRGDYHMLSGSGQVSPCWFISQTSMLNLFDANTKITWQPEAFLRFASTLVPIADSRAVDQAFETILLGIAESGLNLLDEKSVNSVFGGVIDEATLNVAELNQAYHELLEEKYGEPLDQVLSRVRQADRPMAVVQLSKEIIETQAVALQKTEFDRVAAEKRAKAAERALGEVAEFRDRQQLKRARAKQKQRAAQSTKGKKGRRK